MKRVAVLGEGAWGSAIALLLADNGYTVNLWCHDAHVADEIIKTRYNTRYFKDFVIPTSIHPTASMQEALADTHWVFEAIPVQYLRSVLRAAQPFFTNDQIWIVLSKGIEQDTLLLPTQMIDDVYGHTSKKAVLAGPSFAHDLARKQPTAVSLAATDTRIADALYTMLKNEYFKPYIQEDMLGIQVGGAVKNIIALAIGMVKGNGYGDNATAFLLTRALQEMSVFTKALGGQAETSYALCGVGDLILTCLSTQSKNLHVGLRLGRGEKLASILADTGYIPEGINSVRSLYQYAQQHSLAVPICRAVYASIFEDQNPSIIIAALLSDTDQKKCA